MLARFVQFFVNPREICLYPQPGTHSAVSCQAHLHNSSITKVSVWMHKFLSCWWMVQMEALSQAQQKERGKLWSLSQTQGTNATTNLLPAQYCTVWGSTAEELLIAVGTYALGSSLTSKHLLAPGTLARTETQVSQKTMMDPGESSLYPAIRQSQIAAIYLRTLQCLV